MDKSIKFYKRSIELYEKGYIDKAINICNKSVGINRKNKSSMSFLGLLYYLKGDLNLAKKNWDMNYKYNKDMVSKKYLENIEQDKIRYKLYIEAVRFYNKLKINEALEILNKCEDSDFNSINVHNYLCFCHIKKGNYEKAIISLDKVLSLDRKNAIALENKKMLVNYGIMKRKISLNRVSIWIALLVVIVASSFAVKNLYFNNKKAQISVNNKVYKDEHKKNKESLKTTSTKKEKEKTNTKIKENKEIVKKKTVAESSKTDKFNMDAVKKYCDNSDFNSLYNYINLYKRNSLTINEKVAYDKGVELLKTKGVEYFYNNSLENIKSHRVNEAKTSLIKAYSYSKGSFLREHIVYFLGDTYEKDEDAKNALKYYSEYYKDNPKGSYIEAVIYKLAILNNYEDKTLSKKYAKELTYSYPKSIFNNSKIKEILNN
ncbi:tetratricopeptide repeat protein [Haloimpatiens sp. FM7315]|uniref:tetratricopeptide repeat protein n=1 Tax=Haloimpatiens sp. FM7315 TaxID=3298609 RepID=UPI00370CABF2